MTEKDFGGFPNGVYRLFYDPCDTSSREGRANLARSGDHVFSIGAIGRDERGRVWFAPCNWISDVPCFDLGYLDHVELITTQAEEVESFAKSQVAGKE